DYGTLNAPFEMRHFFRAFINQQNDQECIRMMKSNRTGELMKQSCLAGSRWRNDQRALSFSDRSHEFHKSHDAPGRGQRSRSKNEALRRINTDLSFKGNLRLKVVQRKTVDLNHFADSGRFTGMAVIPMKRLQKHSGA